MKIPLGEYDKAKTFPNAFIKIRFWHDLAVHDRTRCVSGFLVHLLFICTPLIKVIHGGGKWLFSI